MQDIGKMMLAGGLVIAFIGLLLMFGVGKGWLGQLPGDINVSGSRGSFHFPIVTCVVISVVLSFLMWLFRR